MSGVIGAAGSKSGVIGTGVSDIDYYEEGAWTPTQGSGITLVGSFTSAGWYTKTGNIVHLTAWIQGSTSIAISAGSSTVVGGIPFYIADSSSLRYTFQAGGNIGGGGYAWSTNLYNYALSPNITATGSKIYFQLTHKAGART